MADSSTSASSIAVTRYQDPKRGRRALQRYHALNLESLSILHQTSSTVESPTDMAPSSTFSSNSSSPTLSPRSAAASLSTTTLPTRDQRRKSSCQRSPTISAIPEDGIFAAEPTSIEDCARLLDINFDIKSTLTDLLNCDAVKSDSRMRSWVQSRLMDAELELKRQRKRRISGSSFVSTASSN